MTTYLAVLRATVKTEAVIFEKRYSTNKSIDWQVKLCSAVRV